MPLVAASVSVNTISKWAHGISGTLALGLTHEDVGLGLPIVVAPWLGPGLLHHPVLRRSIGELRGGARVIFGPDRLARSGGSAAFPWDKVRIELAVIVSCNAGRPQKVTAS